MNEFWQWWQNIPSNLDPYIIKIGPFPIGWYGMMYVAAFTTFYFACRYRIKRGEGGDNNEFTQEIVQDFLLWAAFGLIIGARFGYALFYNYSYYIAHPLEIIMPFDPSSGKFTGISGMSYHGGLLGTIIASAIFFRKHKLSFLKFADFAAPAIPLGYIFGRMGNFINSELYGRATDVPWGMYFPTDPTHTLRHASQLYEAGLEGLLLFIILWSIRNRPFARGLIFPIYIAGYGIVRFIAEFYRQPDDHIGFVVASFSMGQLLCFAMILGGAILAVIQKKWISGFKADSVGD